MIRQPAKLLVSKETVQRSIAVPLQKKPLHVTSPADFSQQSLHVHRVKLSVLPLLILSALLGDLLTSVGIGMSLWLYSANDHTTGSISPTPIRRIASTPSTVSTAYPDLVKLYNGTIHSIPENDTTTMSLTNIQQQQGYITGSFAGLHESNPFRGSITPDKHIEFVVMADAQHSPIAFDGFILPNATIAGTYYVQNPVGQCVGYGVWSITPVELSSSAALPGGAAIALAVATTPGNRLATD